MRVKELKELLAAMPDDAFVRYVWDGEPRSTVRHVWLARCGAVMLADEREVVYSADSRPKEAPGDEEPYWHTESVAHEDDEDEF